MLEMAMDKKWTSDKGVSQSERNFVIQCLSVSQFAFFEIKKDKNVAFAAFK